MAFCWAALSRLSASLFFFFFWFLSSLLAEVDSPLSGVYSITCTWCPLTTRLTPRRENTDSLLTQFMFSRDDQLTNWAISDETCCGLNRPLWSKPIGRWSSFFIKMLMGSRRARWRLLTGKEGGREREWVSIVWKHRLHLCSRAVQVNESALYIFVFIWIP